MSVLLYNESDNMKPTTQEEGYHMKERTLTNTLFSALSEGVLKPLLDAVKMDDTLDLEFRGSSVNIYYRGGSLFKISESRGNFAIFFEKKYCSEHSTQLTSAPTIDYAVRNIPLYKQAMDWWFHKHPKNEREFQQVIARENNNHRKISGATDYFIADIEFAEDGSRFDMVALKWLSKSSVRKDPSKVSLALIEVKYGDGALEGTSGVKKHLDDFQSFLNDKPRVEDFCNDMTSVFKQKCELGLIDGLQQHQYRDLKISPENPEVILIFANHDPDSKRLSNSLGQIDPSAYTFPILIAGASNMGYCLYSDCMRPL